MRDLHDPEIEKFRFLDHGYGPGDKRNGAFVVPSPETNEPLRILASAGCGWDHVSVSLEDRCPTWAEMEHIKKLFLGDAVAMQLHMPESDHVNNHPFTLHIWRPRSKMKRIPTPPKFMV